MDKAAIYRRIALSQRQILDSSNFKQFADNNFKFDEDGRKFYTWVETLCEKEKLLVRSNFFFSFSVFKRLVLQKHKNQGLFEKGIEKTCKKRASACCGYSILSCDHY